MFTLSDYIVCLMPLVAQKTTCEFGVHILNGTHIESGYVLPSKRWTAALLYHVNDAVTQVDTMSTCRPEMWTWFLDAEFP